jgi:thiamine-phosphate pyrophosphorylase
LALSYYITARRELAAGAGSPEEALKEIVRAAYRAGVDYVQVREKDLPGRRLAALVEDLLALPGKASSRLLVNDRLDVARASGADGLHLPADSLPVAAVRGWVGPSWMVGASCHNALEVERAAADGADYALLGPVFATPSKPGAQPLGLQRLAEICGRVSIPVFALGGVDLGNAGDCVAAGARGVAGIRLFQQAADLEAVCRHLRAL